MYLLRLDLRRDTNRSDVVTYEDSLECVLSEFSRLNKIGGCIYSSLHFTEVVIMKSVHFGHIPESMGNVIFPQLAACIFM